MSFITTTSSSGAATAWGSITGSLASQSDLSSALALKAPLASPTFTGTVKTDSTYIQSAHEYDAGNSSTALTVNFSNGSNQKVTMTGNCTFSFSNPVTGATYLFKLVQDATGARTYTWPAAVKWSGGVAPTGSAATKTDLVSMYYDGTSYYATSSLNY